MCGRPKGGTTSHVWAGGQVVFSVCVLRGLGKFSALEALGSIDWLHATLGVLVVLSASD